MAMIGGLILGLKVRLIKGAHGGLIVDPLLLIDSARGPSGFYLGPTTLLKFSVKEMYGG